MGMTRVGATTLKGGDEVGAPPACGGAALMTQPATMQSEAMRRSGAHDPAG